MTLQKLAVLYFLACITGHPFRAHANEPFTIAWDPNPEANVEGYLVLYGFESGEYIDAIDAGSSTEVTFPSAKAPALDSGSTYYFVVKAYNNSGISNASAEVSFVPNSGSTPPLPARYSLISLEAESATLASPMSLLYHSEASSKLFATGTTAGGSLEFTQLNFASAGLYYAWVRVLTLNHIPNAFTITANNAATHTYQVDNPCNESWRWSRIATPLDFTEGLNTLTITASESNLAIDRIILTTEENFEPSDTFPNHGDAVVLTTQPLSQELVIGGEVTLNVEIISTGPATYQWLKDDIVIPGKTSATLAFANIQAAHAGEYKVIATTGSNSTTSSAAILSAPIIPPGEEVEPDEPQPTLVSMQPQPNSSVSLLIFGAAGQDVRIEVSDNFEDWTVLQTLRNDTGILNVIDPGPLETDGAPRFYRVVPDS